jgi:membrane protein
VYGAAGSLVVILIWLYYSAQILLFGAEISQAHSCIRRGCRAEPKENAVQIPERERKAEGLEARRPIPRFT